MCEEHFPTQLSPIRRMPPSDEQRILGDVITTTTSNMEAGTGEAVLNSMPEVLSRPTQRLVYPKTTCATCEAPLDVTEQSLNIELPNLYCSQTRSTDHLPLLCQGPRCGEKFATLQDLKIHFHTYHPNTQYHTSFNCSFPECGQPLRMWQVQYHFQTFHADARIYCSQCGIAFVSAAQLDTHASEAHHAAYVCRFSDCDSEFTRVGELNRHQLVHQSSAPRHSCPHCRKYRGSNGFKRMDHLRQHIRNYHHINPDAHSEVNQSGYPCDFENCDRVGMSAFDTEQLLKAHLRKEHPSPFQCSHPGCERVGTKGWFRKSDMVRHMRKKHGA
ncbi:hypothetical protein BKA65DRAFT_506006 [Rhexocercosporidium sp. MPI-PUGE-AT-0058]|nr:hypothetical protein BKA65DRAFT_506006 [Rhexocercosporidium sp. MPI-PUGE-AT-0058]